MSVWDVFWSMLVFFMWFLFFWMLIMVFGDIFRRRDLGGGAKAGWTVLVIFIPLIGILIYLIARPKNLAQDKEMMEQTQTHQRRTAGYSAADEIAKAQALKDSGAISDAEFEELKRKAMG